MADDGFLSDLNEWHAVALGFLGGAIYVFTQNLIGWTAVLFILGGTAGLVAEQNTPLSEEPWYALLGVVIAIGAGFYFGIIPS